MIHIFNDSRARRLLNRQLKSRLLSLEEWDDSEKDNPIFWVVGKESTGFKISVSFDEEMNRIIVWEHELDDDGETISRSVLDIGEIEKHPDDAKNSYRRERDFIVHILVHA